MNYSFLPILLLPIGALIGTAPAAAQQPTVSSIRGLPAAKSMQSRRAMSAKDELVTPRYGKFEASWTLPHQTGNPFDPQDNDIQVAFQGPHGLRAVVPAFWDGDRWRVRYAPPQAGRYTLHVLRGGQDARAEGLTAGAFQCAPSPDAGFVHAKARPAPRFVLDNGQPYYPLGMDVAWTGGTGPDYPAYFADMGQAHMNWTRVWMNHWDGKNLDWAQDKAGNPPRGYLLMDVARRWDMIFDNAARNGVYVQMTLQHHGQYTTKTDSNWADNPWNAANGGFLHAPDDFFTDAEARRLTKAKYRYIVARWGYSTHLLSYELFNEVQNIGEANTHFRDVIAWHKEMAAYIRSLDTSHHLITTSYSDPGTPLAQIGLDYDQIHTYPPDIVSYFAALKPVASVPVFVGEWGYGGSGSLADKRAFLHNGIWSGMMAPTAGAGQFWYGDAVMANGWWPEFRSATGFLQTLHVPNIPSQGALMPSVSAAGNLADLSFAPPEGWGPTTKTSVTLAPGGVTPDLSGVSSYVQGNGHRDLLPKPIVFSLNCAQPSEFRLEMGTVAAGGAHPILTLDGQPAQERDFPAAPKDHEAGQSLSIQVPVGMHQVGVFNTGPDWFVLNHVVVSHYAPPVAALARGTTTSAVFWAYARPGGPPTVQGAQVLFPTLTPGTYKVQLWDIVGGRPLPGSEVKASKSGLRISLPVFSRDIAGVAAKVY